MNSIVHTLTNIVLLEKSYVTPVGYWDGTAKAQPFLSVCVLKIFDSFSSNI